MTRRIEIKREFISTSIANGGPPPENFMATVWRHDGKAAIVCVRGVPEGFVGGLYVGYVNGEVVPLAELDEVLADVGITREAILEACQEVVAACTECDGRGTVLDAPDRVLDGHPYWIPCPLCKGA